MSREAVIARAQELADAGKPDQARELLSAFAEREKGQSTAPAENAAPAASQGGSRGFMRYVDPVMSGITGGWWPEIVGGFEAAAGGDPEKVMSDIRGDSIFSEAAQHRAQYPGATLLGETAGGLLTGAGLMRGVTTAPRAIGLGIGEGAAAGAGFAGPGNRTSGAVTGGALGGILSAGGAGTGGAMSRVGSAVRLGDKRITRKMIGKTLEDSGMPPEMIYAELSKLGPTATLADLSPRTQALLRKSFPEADLPSQQTAQGRMDRRADQRLGALRDQAESSFGPGGYQQQLDDLGQQRQREASGLYEDAFSYDPVFDGTEAKWLRDLANRPSMTKAGKAGTRLAADEGKDFAKMSITEQMHYAKMGLDDMISTEKKPKRKAALVGQKKELTGWLNENVPSYKEATGIYADSFSNQRALESGRDMFKGSFDGDELEAAVKDFSQSEMDNFRIGAKQAFMNQVEVAGPKLTMKQKAVMRRVFGPEEWREMNQTLLNEQRMAQTEAATGNVRAGAPTEPAMASRLTAGVGQGSAGITVAGMLEDILIKLRNLNPEAHGRLVMELTRPDVTSREIAALIRDAQSLTRPGARLGGALTAPVAGATGGLLEE